jgi:YidC/Oxa1 family membrane protein insertase
MDKNYLLIGISMLIAAFALMLWQGQKAQKQAWEQASESTGQETRLDENEDGSISPMGSLSSDNEPPLYRSQDSMAETISSSNSVSTIIPADDNRFSPERQFPEEIYTLENNFIRVDFTSRGGAIKEVGLKKYPAIKGESTPYIFNANSDVPALSINIIGVGGLVEEYAPAYTLLSHDGESITFSLALIPGIDLIRNYTITRALEGAEPYIIKHSTTFKNSTQSVFNIGNLFINVGTAAPAEADPRGFYLNFGYFDNEDAKFINVKKFKGSGFLGFFKRDPVSEIVNKQETSWAAVKNQFFTGILTPTQTGIAIQTRPVEFSQSDDSDDAPEGITGSIEFDLKQVAPSSERMIEMSYYVGPKEYKRITQLEQREDLVMQFGFFGFLSKFMLIVLIAIEKMVGNYGVAIVLMTIVIRGLMWPLTAKSAQSSKKMQQISEPLQALKDKYKDNPQKLQRETLKLFKENKVNPAAGCFPVVIQIPIFISFFYMLRTSSELRFAGFLWIDDLSRADTIATIAGFPLNILPLIMGATMFYQMKIMPTPSIDSAQQKIIKLMPFIFLIFCYTFSSGLVLYWTMSNLISILQQFITNRQKDPLPITSAPTQTKGKGKPRSKQKPKRK